MAIDINEQNFEEALNSDLPVLVDFWADWCGPCRAQAPILDSLDAGKVKVCKVNVDENLNLCQKYSISSIPTMILFKNGMKKDVLVGLHNKNQIENKLNNL